MVLPSGAGVLLHADQECLVTFVSGEHARIRIREVGPSLATFRGVGTMAGDE